MNTAHSRACGMVSDGTRQYPVCTAARKFVRGKLTPDKTLRDMRELVRKARSDPRVYMLARDIAARTNSRDQKVLARALRRWASDRFRYVRDPISVELLSSPTQMIDQIMRAGYMAGDCDEASILTAALLNGAGIPCEFHAVSFSPERPLSHVFTVAKPDGARPIEMDIVRPPGAVPPQRWPKLLRWPV